MSRIFSGEKNEVKAWLSTSGHSFRSLDQESRNNGAKNRYRARRDGRVKQITARRFDSRLGLFDEYLDALEDSYGDRTTGR